MEKRSKRMGRDGCENEVAREEGGGGGGRIEGSL